jgi:PadR family transcriptional regulator, regulatory protein PadR
MNTVSSVEREMRNHGAKAVQTEDGPQDSERDARRVFRRSRKREFLHRYLALTSTVLYKGPHATMTEPIDIQLKKGVLELCVLELLSQEDNYAYEIARRLADAIGMGEGTVYPLMRRLHTEGLVETYFVESNSGPSRKYYRISRAGRAELVRERAGWREFTRAVDSIIGGRK